MSVIVSEETAAPARIREPAAGELDAAGLTAIIAAVTAVLPRGGEPALLHRTVVYPVSATHVIVTVVPPGGGPALASDPVPVTELAAPPDRGEAPDGAASRAETAVTRIAAGLLDRHQASRSQTAPAWPPRVPPSAAVADRSWQRLLGARP